VFLQQLAVIRYNEQAAAAAVLNVSSVDMLNFADGLLNNAPEMMVRERLVIAIRTHKPRAVFTWSPYLDFEMYVNGREHPDHRTTGQIVLDAVYPSARGACVCVCVFVCACVCLCLCLCVPVSALSACAARLPRVPGAVRGRPGDAQSAGRVSLLHRWRDVRVRGHHHRGYGQGAARVVVFRCQPVLWVMLCNNGAAQIKALEQHVSQYTNATNLADNVLEFGALVAQDVGIAGYAEGFIYIPQMP
jgi:LmbE family N-acetylglucosaminyl deacetylase